MIRERKQLRRTGQAPTCLLDYLIGLSTTTPTFTEDDIVDEATTLMLAGQDSVGSAIAFFTFLIAQNQESQQICRSEVDKMFLRNSHPSLDDFKRLTYLDQCLKETLRLYPSVPLIARRLSQPIRLQNVLLPTGSNVLIFPYATHRIDKIYPNPEIFDPNRFSHQATSALHPFAYIPFSAGPRNCIGLKFSNLEMVTILANILRHFEIYPSNRQSCIKPMFRVSLRASGGVWVQFKKRVF